MSRISGRQLQVFIDEGELNYQVSQNKYGNNLSLISGRKDYIASPDTIFPRGPIHQYYNAEITSHPM